MIKAEINGSKVKMETGGTSIELISDISFFLASVDRAVKYGSKDDNPFEEKLVEVAMLFYMENKDDIYPDKTMAINPTLMDILENFKKED
jgi:hypothetical protein|nr:MAG TPA: hypothetical protein [Caudoviricetes sp.]